MIYSESYVYNNKGFIVEKVVKDGDLTNTFNYIYDKIGQLTEVKKNNSTIETYSYDSNGNRLNNNAQYDSQDRLISNNSASFTYTERGTLLTRTENNQITSYNYDLMGNLLSVTLPNSTEIEYITDARNRRIAKKVNGTVVQKFLYLNQLEPIAELDANDNIISLFVYGTRSNTPDYIIKNNVKYKVVTNQLGSVVKVVNTTNGTVEQSIEYDSFGNILSDSNPSFQPFRLAGGFYDVDTKLTRFGARDYDAREGRWTTKDPIKFDGGMNFYVYVGNNPVNYVDLDGRRKVRKGRGWGMKGEVKYKYSDTNISVEEAMIKLLKDVACRSLNDGLESGVRVDKVGEQIDSYISEDMRYQGEVVLITSEKAQAYGHVHINCSMNAEPFSEEDKAVPKKTGKPFYLLTINGTIKKLNSDGSETILKEKFDFKECSCKSNITRRANDCWEKD